MLRFLAPCTLALAFLGSTVPDLLAQPVAVTSKLIALSADTELRTQVGRLIWRGGLLLSSSEDLFGGLSAMAVDSDGAAITLLTDEGNWCVLRPRYDAQGNLAGIAEAECDRLRNIRGEPLPESKWWGDSESLTRWNGSAIVGFEGRTRILSYRPDGKGFGGAATRFPTSEEIDDLPQGRGLEALATLSDGRILAFAEGREDEGARPAFLYDGQSWSRLSLSGIGDFRPTGADTLPNGDVILLERSFSFFTGFEAQIRLISGADVFPGAHLEGEVLATLREPYVRENFEGISARPGPDGKTFIYLVSDDNFLPFQDTLLVMFEIDGQSASRPHDSTSENAKRPENRAASNQASLP